MPEPNPAGREVEQTMSLARDAIERDIARYRVWLYGACVPLTGIVYLITPLHLWFPTAFLTGCFAYALVFWSIVRRSQVPVWLPFASLVFDLAATSANFLVSRLFGTAATLADHPVYASYILAPVLMCWMLVNSLRYSRASSALGAIVAPAVFLMTMRIIAGYFPAQIVVAALLALAGLVSVAAASQARQNLDRFARLQLLRRYLPPAAVERVMRDDPDAALALGGRLVTVTLLAADLRGFTAMSEKLAPKEVMAQLNAYHGAMIGVIERNGGAIDKFIGDGTLVVFGLDGSAETAARAAVRCAAEMLDALEDHNGARAGLGQPPLRMGIGVHTGPVIAGNLGVPGWRLEFTVIGDAVNTFSRLEGLTKERGVPVLVSAETVALLEDAGGLRSLPAATMRGKEHELGIYALAEGSVAAAG
jgi:adenylate cyclase